MSTTLSVRVPPEVAAELEELAASTDRPKSWHMEQALKNYLEVQAWQLAHIEKAMQQVKEGKLLAHETVVKRARAYARKLDAIARKSR